MVNKFCRAFFPFNDRKGPPQPQKVGFHDLLGVGIAPLSKTPDVKKYLI